MSNYCCWLELDTFFPLSKFLICKACFYHRTPSHWWHQHSHFTWGGGGLGTMFRFSLNHLIFAVFSICFSHHNTKFGWVILDKKINLFFLGKTTEGKVADKFLYWEWSGTDDQRKMKNLKFANKWSWDEDYGSLAVHSSAAIETKVDFVIFFTLLLKNLISI